MYRVSDLLGMRRHRGWHWLVVAAVAVAAPACGSGASRARVAAQTITTLSETTTTLAETTTTLAETTTTLPESATTFPPNTPAHIVTWTLTSGFVDPAAVEMAAPPGPSQPNALRVNVYLPSGYDGIKPFPVLYLLHGATDGYFSWAAAHEGDLLNTVKGFPGIIVMPDGGSFGWYMNWWNGGKFGNPAWESYFFDDLIPQVEHRLKILPGRQYHAIAGYSMGGGGALFLASQLPGYFGTAASFSGTLSMERADLQALIAATVNVSVNTMFGDPVAQHFYWAGHNPTELVANLANTRLYVSVGNGVPQNAADLAADPGLARGEAVDALANRDFVAAAQAANIPVTFVPHAGIHDWPYWRQDLANAIQWNLFAPVPDPPNSWTYLTVAEHGDAFGFHFTFQAPPTAIESFSLANGVLHGSGNGQVTITTPAGQTFTATIPFTH